MKALARRLVPGVAGLAAVVAGVVLLGRVPSGPRPLRYGVDACAECRMHLTRPGFGGELRDADGRLTTYDDVGCLLRAMLKRHGAMPEAWVEDHAGGGFVSLLAAHLVRAPEAETPMGHGIVAFRDEAAADAFAAAAGGTRVALEDLVRDLTRVASAAGHAKENR
ncbi:MAG TPA: nitrous oxide reductase accessory protein NosL [Candidatus Binatia bacterium]|jgi:copper chaperone NosL|nr:nitrous oxide reductase accessory protein NosL [Candidatus Binatia bacterium]